MFLNSRGLGDLAKHLFLPFQKWVDEILHKVGIDFVRHSHPLHGRSSGILLGNMTGTMDVLACLDGEFHVMLHILKLHMESCCCLWCCQFKADFFL
jgi:hypothetical protein